MSDCRSFGSNCHTCSQTRKISIGVMVDASVKTRPEPTMEDVVATPAAEKVTSSKVSVDDGNNREGVKDTTMGKRTETIELENTPWVSPRSFRPKYSTSEAVHFAKLTTNFPDASLNGLKMGPTTSSVQFSAHQISAVQPGNEKQNKFDWASYRREGFMDGTREREEEFSFGTAHEILVPEKDVVEDKTNRTENRSEVLRMKLWEILGPVSSPNKDTSSAPDVGINNLNLEQNHENKSKTVVKPRQSSDTIESDSECPDHTIERPITRSLTRKRAQSKVQTKKIRNASSSNYTRKQPEKKILSFEEGFSRRLDGTITGGCSKSSGKKRDRSLREAQRVCFPAQGNANEIEQAAELSKTTKCAGKTSSHRIRMGGLDSCSPENKRKFVKLGGVFQKKDSLQLPVVNLTDQLGNINNSSSPEHQGQQERFTNSPRKNISDLQSPTFEIQTSSQLFSPGSPQKTDHGELNDQSPACCRINCFSASKTDYNKTDVGNEASDDAEEVECSPPRRPKPSLEENDAENGMSISSSGERNSKSSKEGPRFSEDSETKSPSLEIGTAGKSKVVFHPYKRFESQEDINFNRFYAISTSPNEPSLEENDAENGMSISFEESDFKSSKEGSPINEEIDKSNGIKGSSDQHQKDGLADAINLFALALERLKSKIKAVTRKKSVEVLTSVAEGMYLQLQNAESLIQRDVGKLTSVSKSKQKCLETEYKEQQEKLKLIYQRFKEEVNRHLEECRGTLEELEAQGIEFREMVEKHKASQRKLLKQVEQAAQTQLNDAQRRITAVQELGREKMLQLKYVVAECLKEGMLT